MAMIVSTVSNTDPSVPDGSVRDVDVALDAAISADKFVDGVVNKLMLATERTKLSGIATGATANSSNATLLARANHTGTQSADTVVDGTTNKVLTAAEQTKLAGVATGATANSADATLLARANHTGTQSADTLTDGTTNKAFTATERTKLTGVATAATANATDAQLRDRATHTGAQAISTVTSLQTTLDAKLAKAVGNVVTMTGDDVQWLRANITNIANSSTTFWADRLAFYFDNDEDGVAETRTGYHNEYGELRARPAKSSTIAFRALGHTNAGVADIVQVTSWDQTAIYFRIHSTNGITCTLPITAPNIGVKVSTGTSAPSSPATGDIWVDTN